MSCVDAGKTITVGIVDRCEGCSTWDLDLSPSAFQQVCPMILNIVEGSVKVAHRLVRSSCDWSSVWCYVVLQLNGIGNMHMVLWAENQLNLVVVYCMRSVRFEICNDYVVFSEHLCD